MCAGGAGLLMAGTLSSLKPLRARSVLRSVKVNKGYCDLVLHAEIAELRSAGDESTLETSASLMLYGSI